MKVSKRSSPNSSQMLSGFKRINSIPSEIIRKPSVKKIRTHTPWEYGDKQVNCYTFFGRLLLHVQAAVHRCFLKKLFLKISQNSQENTFVVKGN